MGKAKGPKRKKTPARKRLLSGNSGLADRQSHRRKDGRVHHYSAELKGGATVGGKRSVSKQLLLPNKQGRRDKRRRKGDSLVPQRCSSEAAAIQAEYKAVDAREKARKDAEEAQRRRGPVKIKLAPASTDLRMPSEKDPSMASLRASSSASMVEALLQSITDDPAPLSVLPSRPVRSAGRKRKGNLYASLEAGGSESDESEKNESNDWGVGNGLAGEKIKVRGLAFAPPSGFGGFRSIPGAAPGGRSTEAGAGSGSAGPRDARAHGLDDPDL